MSQPVSVLCRVSPCTPRWRSSLNLLVVYNIAGPDPCVEPNPAPPECLRPVYNVQRDIRVGDGITGTIDSMKGTTLTLTPNGALNPTQVTFFNNANIPASVLTQAGFVAVAPSTSLNLNPSDFPSLQAIHENVLPVCGSCIVDNKAFSLYGKAPIDPASCGLVDRIDYWKYSGVPVHWFQFDWSSLLQACWMNRFMRLKKDCNQAILKVFTFGIDLTVLLKQKRWIWDTQLVELIGLRACDQVTFSLSESTQQLQPTVTNPGGVCPESMQYITIFTPAQITSVYKPGSKWSEAIVAWNNDGDSVLSRITVTVTSQAVISY